VGSESGYELAVVALFPLKICKVLRRRPILDFVVQVRWQKTEEIKGLGMKAITKEGDVYMAGSYKIAAARFQSTLRGRLTCVGIN